MRALAAVLGSEGDVIPFVGSVGLPGRGPQGERGLRRGRVPGRAGR